MNIIAEHFQEEFCFFFLINNAGWKTALRRLKSAESYVSTILTFEFEFI